MKTDLFYMLSFKVVPIGFYTFFPAFWQLFYSLFQKFLVWVRTDSWTYEFTALLSWNRTPSKPLLSVPNKENHLRLYLDFKVGGEWGPTLAS